MKKCKTVEDYINGQDLWQTGLVRLRNIAMQTEMLETVKWGVPTYTVNGKNVIGFGAFNSYFAIWFFQGVFRKDKHGKLVNAQPGVTKALGQWRFTSVDEIEKKLVLAYLQETIQNQKLGKVVQADRSKPTVVPHELRAALQESRAAQNNFEAFSLSKKREYAEYISTAKRDVTKVKRLAKIMPMIESNIGLNDKYRNC